MIARADLPQSADADDTTPALTLWRTAVTSHGRTGPASQVIGAYGDEDLSRFDIAHVRLDRISQFAGVSDLFATAESSDATHPSRLAFQIERHWGLDDR